MVLSLLKMGKIPTATATATAIPVPTMQKSKRKRRPSRSDCMKYWTQRRYVRIDATRSLERSTRRRGKGERRKNDTRSSRGASSSSSWA